MLTERYRVVGLLGKGGMGEVYRADDLKLRQPVALKFLPKALANKAHRLERFLNEVRVARQVSHPNVCRVYDIGEAEGQHFISMEHVDGEDLASLIRRIGRLPQDKAVQIARQLCAGLAAAHEKGVLHRDLKPHNVMIDGRGKVRITDFGLAGFAADFAEDARDVGAGTPAYMAPEQLEGREVTIKSDIYSLGLVLYQLFTGQPAFKANTREEMLRMRGVETVTTPTSIIADLDPAVERVIMRCLERDPRQRPSSALTVSAALPGGDPLAAALEAGETPSPDMVAAAGEEGVLRPWVAVALLLCVFAGLVGTALISRDTRLIERIDLPEPPQVLAKQARDIVERLGHSAPGRDSAYGLEYDSEILRFIPEAGSIHEWLDESHTDTVPFIRFWYRESPTPLVATTANMHYEFSLVQAGRVSPTDPPLSAGMITVRLDPQGRLLEFVAIPDDLEARPDEEDLATSPDWGKVLSLSGVDPAAMTPTEPVRTPKVFCDTRTAWEGSFAGDADVPMRIEACAVGGKVVWFQTFGPWSMPGSADPAQPTAPMAAARTMDAIYGLSLIIAGSLLALRNHRLRRSDGRGAFRLAVFVFFALLVSWALSADHVAGIGDEVNSLLLFALAKCLFWTGFLWMMYLALEPYVRRRWPERIISWSRLLSGRLRDPLVGRDVLTGLAIGAVSVPLLSGLNNSLREVFGLTGFISTDEVPLAPLLGVRVVGGVAAGALVDGIRLALVYLISPLLVQMLVRRLWIAALVVWLVLTTFVFLGSGISTVWSFAYYGVWNALFLIVAIRLGLLTCAALWFGFWALSTFPITSDMSKWYAGESLFGLLLLAGLATAVFYTSLSGRPLFKDELLDA